MERELKALPPPDLVYAGGIHRGTGSFRGTGPEGGRPRPIHVLARGQVTQPGRAVAPGTHTITLVTVGTSGRPRVDLDAFIVLR